MTTTMIYVFVRVWVLLFSKYFDNAYSFSKTNFYSPNAFILLNSKYTLLVELN